MQNSKPSSYTSMQRIGHVRLYLHPRFHKNCFLKCFNILLQAKYFKSYLKVGLLAIYGQNNIYSLNIGTKWVLQLLQKHVS